MNRYEIGIWGQFGDGGVIADGQAVRTTIITDELKNKYGENNILITNTNNWKKHPFVFLKKSIDLLRKCKAIIIFPADNGFKIVVPLYHLCNAVFRKKLYYVVIGGFLPALLKEKPMYKHMLMKYKALFVQTNTLKNDLEKIGLSKVYILSNLKRLNTCKKEEKRVSIDKCIKVCTLSRINDSKGIKYAMEAVKLTNEKLGDNLVKLDIYGIIEKSYEEEFYNLIEKYKDVVSYRGVLKYNDTTSVLKSYFAMLFPTFYYGEGFPGNVIDAYNAGIPMIATRWNYNSDVIKDKRNGYLVDIKNSNEICEKLLYMYQNREEVYRISLNNLEDAMLYTPDTVLKEFYKLLNEEIY